MSARRLSVVVGAVLFAAAVYILGRELGSLGPGRILAAFRAERRGLVSLAFTLVVLNYFVLTIHDQLAVAYVGRRLARWRVAVASFVGFAVGNTLGMGVVSGATARYRFYSRWSINAGELSRIVAFYNATFGLGLLIVGGVSVALAPPEALTAIVPDVLVRAGGIAAAAIPLCYVALCEFRSAPIRIGRVEIAVPSTAMALAQITASTIDWVLAAATIYVLLPAPRPPFIAVASAFTAAQLVALASHVPGGVAVFDGLLLLFLRAWTPSDGVLQALLLFRLLYNLLPLLAAVLLLVGDEALQRRGLPGPMHTSES